MKKLFIMLILILSPLIASATEVTITDYDGRRVRAITNEPSYNLMINWNQQASQIGYPLIKPISFKGTVGFEITNKAQYYPLYNHNTNQIDQIDLYIEITTTDTELKNYINLLKKYTSQETSITLKYSPSDPRSRH